MEAWEEARLRQCEVLWAEIARRSNAQQALIAATVTATGTVGGLVAAQGADSALLLSLGLVAPVFGLLWLDHAQNIREIGHFIASAWHWTPNWEAGYEEAKHVREGRNRFYFFVFAISIVFLAPSLDGLASSVCILRGDPGLLSAWISGLVLTVLFVVGWGFQLRKTWPPRTSSDTDTSS